MEIPQPREITTQGDRWSITFHDSEAGYRMFRHSDEDGNELEARINIGFQTERSEQVGQLRSKGFVDKIRNGHEAKVVTYIQAQQQADYEIKNAPVGEYSMAIKSKALASRLDVIDGVVHRVIDGTRMSPAAIDAFGDMLAKEEPSRSGGVYYARTETAHHGPQIATEVLARDPVAQGV